MVDATVLFPALAEKDGDGAALHVLNVGLDRAPVDLTGPQAMEMTAYGAAAFSDDPEAAIGAPGAAMADLVALQPLAETGATVLATRSMALFRLVMAGDPHRQCRAMVVTVRQLDDGVLGALAALPTRIAQVAILLEGADGKDDGRLNRAIAATGDWAEAEALPEIGDWTGLRLVRRAQPDIAVPRAAAPATATAAPSTMRIENARIDEAEVTGTLIATEPVRGPLPQVVASRDGVPVAIAPVRQQNGALTFRMDLPRDVLFDAGTGEIELRVGQTGMAATATAVTLPKRRLLSAERLLAFDRPDSDAKPARKPLGIVLYSFTRTDAAMLVLESLKRQGALPLVEIWMDGDQGKPATKKALEEAEAKFRAFGVEKITRHRGNLGFRKLILQSLMYMVDTYDRFIVLEDDCFPSGVAIEEFTRSLDRHADNPDVLTTYGHHFEIENETPYCPRFQGWGWATYSDRFRPFLAELAYLFSLPESAYLDWTHSVLTPEITAKIDATAPRGASITVQRFFAWDETLALISALAGAVHAPTERRCIYNFGVGEDSTHFSNIDWYRKPPFNMILKSEVWDHF